MVTIKKNNTMFILKIYKYTGFYPVFEYINRSQGRRIIAGPAAVNQIGPGSTNLV